MRFQSIIVVSWFHHELHYGKIRLKVETLRCRTINYQYERQISWLEFYYHSNPSAPFHGPSTVIKCFGHIVCVGKAILFLCLTESEPFAWHNIDYSIRQWLPFQTQQILRQRLSMAFFRFIATTFPTCQTPQVLWYRAIACHGSSRDGRRFSSAVNKEF